MRQSEVYTSDDITREVKALKRMTRFDSNSDYRGLLYYAIGNLYKSRGDTAQAVTNYRLSLESQPEGNTDKGFTLLSLGDIYFKRKGVCQGSTMLRRSGGPATHCISGDMTPISPVKRHP